MKKTLMMGIILLVFSCAGNDDNFSPSGLEVNHSMYLLKEYDEDSKKLYSFSYKGEYLESNTIYDDYGLTNFDYHYNLPGRPDTIFVTQPVYDYYIIPEFNDTLISVLNIYIQNDLKLKYIMSYNDDNKIIQVSKVSIRSGLVARSLFTWEGNNIKTYEIQFMLVIPPVDYVYEYEYDEWINPYKNVFRNIGFNLIDFIPISENNWLKMVGYNKNYPQNRLTIRNQFAYSGPGFPFVSSKSKVDYDGSRSEILGKYEY